MNEPLTGEIDRLAARVSEPIRDELSTVRRGLARATRGVELSDVRLSFACNQRWDDMIGDERVRVCAGCDRAVFNLSAMTRAEAEAVLATRGLTPCIRFYRRPDGTVMTSDCPKGSARRSPRLAVLAAGTSLAIAPAALADPPPAQASEVAGSDGDAASGSATLEAIFGADDAFASMGVFASREPAPVRPTLEWSLWGRIGVGLTSQPTDVDARTTTTQAAATSTTATWDAAVSIDLTLGVARDGNVRLGGWRELRTSSGPVAGGELVLENFRPAPYDGRVAGAGLVVRVGANPSVLTGAIGIGYVGSYGEPPSSWSRHVVGGRVVLSYDHAIDARAWSATIGLEVEPIGLVHYLIDRATTD